MESLSLPYTVLLVAALAVVVNAAWTLLGRGRKPFARHSKAASVLEPNESVLLKKVAPLWANYAPYDNGRVSFLMMHAAILTVMGPTEWKNNIHVIDGHVAIFDEDPEAWNNLAASIVQTHPAPPKKATREMARSWRMVKHVLDHSID